MEEKIMRTLEAMEHPESFPKEELHKLIREELDMNMPLLKQGDVARADILRMQRGVSDIEAQHNVGGAASPC